LKELLLKWLDNSQQQSRLNADEIEVRVRAFVIIVVTLILMFIVVSLIYSVTFVTQPIKSMAPIDQAYTKMLNDIVLLIVGGIGGIMTKGLTNEATNMMNAAKANKDAYVAPPPPPVTNITMAAPASWTPPPPPANPPHYLEPDEDRAALAAAREEMKGQ
jgi:flagellar basal body-associated protein FliL